VNRGGFRDVEHTEAALRSTRRLLVLGDSFAAGSGVPDYRDRFANLLEDRLGEKWSMVLLAKPGWHTDRQLEALEGFPLAPSQVLLSYYLNDIEAAAARHDRTFDLDLSIRPRWLSELVGGTDLGSFVYWRLRRATLRGAGLRYAEFVYACFWDEEIWKTHADQLRELFRVARRKGALVSVVAFPHLFDLEGSAGPLRRLRSLLEEERVPFLDVSGFVGGWEPGDLVAGPLDPHPSDALHREVATRAYPLVVR